jgi:hypothetical protein
VLEHQQVFILKVNSNVVRVKGDRRRRSMFVGPHRKQRWRLVLEPVCSVLFCISIPPFSLYATQPPVISLSIPPSLRSHLRLTMRFCSHALALTRVHIHTHTRCSPFSPSVSHSHSLSNSLARACSLPLVLPALSRAFSRALTRSLPLLVGTRSTPQPGQKLNPLERNEGTGPDGGTLLGLTRGKTRKELVANKLVRAVKATKAVKLLRRGSTLPADDDSHLIMMAQNKVLPQRNRDRLEKGGWDARSVEVLGMVDKETITNLTRVFTRAPSDSSVCFMRAYVLA